MRNTHTHTLSQSMPLSPPADAKHESPDRPRQQHTPTNGNHGDDSIRASPGKKTATDPMEDLHGNAAVIRIGIPDLQQTVSSPSPSHTHACTCTGAHMHAHTHTHTHTLPHTETSMQASALSSLAADRCLKRECCCRETGVSENEREKEGQ